MKDLNLSTRILRQEDNLQKQVTTISFTGNLLKIHSTIYTGTCKEPSRAHVPCPLPYPPEALSRTLWRPAYIGTLEYIAVLAISNKKIKRESTFILERTFQEKIV